MSRLPPLRAVQAFESTARHLSFSRAAEELYVSQSAVSHQIRILEEFLGHSLFSRKNKHISLTQEGDTFYSVINDCFQKMAAVTNSLVKQEAVCLKVIAQTSIAVDWLCPRLANFKQSHNEIELSMAMASQAASFDSEEYDIIVGTWPAPDGFVSKNLREELWYPVCSPSLYKKIDPNDPQSLLGHRLYSSEKGEDWRMWMHQHCISKPSNMELQYFSLALLAVKTALGGEGITLSCGFMVDDLIKQGLLCSLPQFSYTLPWGHYHVHYRSDSYFGKQIESFVNWLVQQANNPEAK